MIPLVPHLETPLHEVMHRVRSELAPKLATSSDDYSDHPGFMGCHDTRLPHLFVDGAAWFPNVFIARIFFLKTHADVTDETMASVTTLDKATFCGVQFFRFRRVDE